MIIARRLTLLAAAAVLAACGGSSSDAQNPRPGQGFLRMMNVVADAPDLRMRAENTDITGEVAPRQLAFTSATGLELRSRGAYEFTVQYLDSDRNPVDLIPLVDFTFAEGDEWTLALIGTLAAPQLVRIENRNDTRPDTGAEFQFLHAANSVSTMQFFLTAASADLAEAVPDASLAFGQLSPLAERSAGGNLRVRVRPPGGAVVYDSGPFQLGARSRQLFVLADYFGPGGPGVRVVPVADGGTSAFPNEPLQNEFRVAHLARGEPAFDIFLEDPDLNLDAPDGAPELAGVAIDTVSDSIVVEGGTYDMFGTLPGDPGEIVFQSSGVPVPSGSRTVLVLAPSVGGDSPVAVGTVTRDGRVIPGQARMRVVHAGSNAAAVDVYVLPPGSLPTEDDSPEYDRLTPLAAAIVGFGAGSYDLVVTTAGTQTVIAGPSAITLGATGNYLVAVADDAGAGTRIVLLDGFVE